MVLNHSICAALLAAAAAAPLAAQQPASPTSTFLVFVRAVQVGSEEVSVVRSAEGWTISGAGRIGPPLDLVTRALQVRYTADWQPLELTVDASSRGQAFDLHITVSGTRAATHQNNAGQTTDRTDTIEAGSLLLPNPFFAAYEALARHLAAAQTGAAIPVYQGSPTAAAIQVGDIETERIQTVARTIDARHLRVRMVAAGAGEVPFEVWIDPAGALLRVSVPTQQFEYVRDDIAAVSTRRVLVSREGDEQVHIPANGFTLAGTLSKPDARAGALPAVVLVAGSGPMDRDEVVAGIPVFGQLAGALADAGYAVLRYDKRGVGQSGGRPESAGLADYADDLRAAVAYLAGRKDIDRRRIALVGHSEGGAVALLEAAKDRRVAAVVLMAAPGVVGSELILAQQRHALDRLPLSDAEKQARVELQKKIHDAVITGKGWDAVPAGLRRQVDTPEFQSILTFDPARAVAEVRQPILIVQGLLDTQVEPSNADRLEALARRRKGGAAVAVVRLEGVNHLFVPAVTGEAAEYPELKDKRITPALPSAIADWLRKTLAARR